MIQREFIINGFPFTIVVSGVYGHNGIILSPEDIEIDNPAFLEAIQVAADKYSTATRVFRAVIGAIDGTHNLTPQEAIYEERGADWALNQSGWKLDQRDVDRLENYLSDLRSLREPMPGWVYLMHDAADGLHKIGYSANPEERRKGLSKSGARVTMLHKIGTNHMAFCELELHEQYKENRVRGEWFRLNPEQIEEIMLLEYVGVRGVSDG